MKPTVFMGTTKIDPQKTIGEISSVLIRTGATQIATDYGAGGKVEAVRFSVSVQGLTVCFRLPCRTEKLLRLLRDKDQAERTAWRQVLRWVEAQAAMVDAGMTQTHEVFMPYAVIPGSDDRTMFQAWESSQKMLEAGE